MKRAIRAEAAETLRHSGLALRTGKEVKAAPSARRSPFQRKRVNFELPERVADQLSGYAEQTGRSKTEFVRTAVGVFALLCDEIAAGNRVLVVQPDGSTPLRELVLPR